MTDPHETPVLKETSDVSAERIARVYAEALYRVAEKTGQAEEVLGELESLVFEVFRRNANLEKFLSSAAVGRDARHDVIAKAFQGRTSQAFHSFLEVLNRHERLELIKPITRAYRELADQRANRLRVYVTSAAPIPEDQRSRLEGEFRSHFKKEPVLLSSVDPTLLGGLKIRVGDVQYDGSVKTRIENLRTQILARGSHEIQSRRDHFRS